MSDRNNTRLSQSHPNLDTGIRVGRQVARSSTEMTRGRAGSRGSRGGDTLRGGRTTAVPAAEAKMTHSPCSGTARCGVRWH